MKVLLAFSVLYLFATAAYPQCGEPKITDSDKTRADVNRKLSCFAKEADSLQRQLESMKDPEIDLSLHGFGGSPQMPTEDACELKASTIAQALGTDVRVFDHGEGFHVGKVKVAIYCGGWPQGVAAAVGLDPSSVDAAMNRVLASIVH